MPPQRGPQPNRTIDPAEVTPIPGQDILALTAPGCRVSHRPLRTSTEATGYLESRGRKDAKRDVCEFLPVRKRVNQNRKFFAQPTGQNFYFFLCRPSQYDDDNPGGRGDSDGEPITDTRSNRNVNHSRKSQ